MAVAVLTIAACPGRLPVRQWIAPYGSVAFLAVLVFATISTTLRLHMWFASQVHPDTLPPLRSRVLRWVVLCEAMLLTILLGLGIRLPVGRTARRRISSSWRCCCSCRCS